MEKIKELDDILIDKSWHVIEWSEVQRSFHVDPFYRQLSDNLLSYFLGNEIQYYPIGLAKSRSDADKIIARFREQREKNLSLKIRTPEIISLETKAERLHMELAEVNAQLITLRKTLQEKDKS